jgi:hypothetical protein
MKTSGQNIRKKDLVNQIINPAVFALISSPLIALIVGALSEQNGDNVLTSIMSTDNLGFHYWSSTRNGNLVAIMAWPFQNIETNLKVQVLIKIAASTFLVTWIAIQISEALSVSKPITLIGAFSTWAFLILKFPESGESFLYGNGPQFIAAVLIAIAIHVSWNNDPRSIKKGCIFLRMISTQLIWIAVGWVSILWLLRAPGFILLYAGTLIARKKINTAKSATAFLLINATYITIAIGVSVVLVSQGTENTSIQLQGALGAIRHNSYIWDYLRIAIVFSIFILFVGNRLIAVFLFLASTWFLFSVVLTSFIGHVQSNHFMPRYFGVGLALSIMVGVVSLITTLQSRFVYTINSCSNLSKRITKVAIIAILAGSVVQYSKQQVLFGTGKIDKTGTTNTGTPLTANEFRFISDLHGIEFVFISGGYWDVWPSIFNLRRASLGTIGLVTPGENQKQFADLLDGNTHMGLCLRVSVENCIQSIQTIKDFEKGFQIEVLEELDTQSGRDYKYRIVKIMKQSNE